MTELARPSSVGSGIAAKYALSAVVSSGVPCLARSRLLVLRGRSERPRSPVHAPTRRHFALLEASVRWTRTPIRAQTPRTSFRELIMCPAAPLRPQGCSFRSSPVAIAYFVPLLPGADVASGRGALNRSASPRSPLCKRCAPSRWDDEVSVTRKLAVRTGWEPHLW